jgi:hypothetical protein
MSYNTQYAPPIVGLATSTVLTEWGSVIYADPSAGVVTLTLPTVVGNAGKSITVKNNGTTPNAFNVTVVPNGAETIDQQTTYTIFNPNDQATFLAPSSGTDVIVQTAYRNTHGVLQVTRSAGTQALAANTDVVFDTIELQVGNLSFDTATGVATLEQGHTYIHEVVLSMTLIVASGMIWGIYQDPGNTLISPLTRSALSETANPDCEYGVLRFLHRVQNAADAIVKVRIDASTAGGTATLQTTPYSQWNIFEVSR